MTTRLTGALSTLTCAVALCAAAPAWAHEKVGVVTTAIGPVTVARAALAPEPLKFKDGVYVHDRVTTGDNAITRILLGGKVVVTARERSTLTITETPGLSTIELSSGRIAVAVEKALMRPGERVDIRTPNAVAGVRGTVLFVETAGDRSTITVTRGLVHVTRLDSVTGVPVGPFTAVGARETVTVRQDVLPARPASIPASRVRELADEFTPPITGVSSRSVVHDTDEVQSALATSAGHGPKEAIDRTPYDRENAVGRTTTPPTAVSARLTSPALAHMPVPALVSTPAVEVPKVKINTKSPNYGSSLLNSANKGAKVDRSGSNSGRN
jgi:hypothetical protein